MHRILVFCMHTNIVVSLASFSLYKVTELLFNFQDTNLGLFIFFATLCAYNYMRLPLFVSFDSNNERIQWIYNNTNSIYFIFFVSAFATLFLSFSLGFSFLKLISPAIVISLLYPLCFNIKGATYSIRDIPFLKIFLIAFAWSYITVLAPLLYYDFELNYFVLDMFFQRFLFLLAISIPFDIRDCGSDNIKTIPNSFGIGQSKFFAWFCLFIIDLLLIIDVINHVVTIPIFIAFFLVVEICSVAIYYSNNSRPLIFYGVFVESLSIIMCLFVLIALLF